MDFRNTNSGVISQFVDYNLYTHPPIHPSSSSIYLPSIYLPSIYPYLHPYLSIYSFMIPFIYPATQPHFHPSKPPITLDGHRMPICEVSTQQNIKCRRMSLPTQMHSLCRQGKSPGSTCTLVLTQQAASSQTPCLSGLCSQNSWFGFKWSI